MSNPYFSSYKNQQEASKLIWGVQMEIIKENNGTYPSDRTLIYKTAMKLEDIWGKTDNLAAKEAFNFYLAS